MAPRSPSLTQLLNPITALRAGMRVLGNAEGRLERRVDVPLMAIAHIEIRGADRPEHAALAADAKTAIERLDGVERAEVDAVVGCLIVVSDPAAIDADDLIESLETVEELHDVADERFPHDRADHPADRMPIHLNVFGIAADVAGLGYATAAQALHFMRLPAEIPGLVSVADNAPRVRRFLEGRLGPPSGRRIVSHNFAIPGRLTISKWPVEGTRSTIVTDSKNGQVDHRHIYPSRTLHIPGGAGPIRASRPADVGTV